ncbi:TPA: hypothetical protein ACGW7B_001236 [Bacillus nitratireducens]|uniref:hypothetical protein n=1 Tax=Bacillus cereus group TaxID=86661 RepID=UPI000A62A66D|nr:MULTISPECIES: hypothetical protein [Bacillus cereus group]MCC2436646.1 hypothetical protein [Bacillus paranthracis]MCU5079354.1 hypothetical protein [Bacillus cereus]MDG1606370.1 hypothetical protein [Bacillus paranthracis]MED1212259.1 hypothetical protein [Bacillus paranthracis]
MTEIQKQVEEYVEWQCRGKAKVIHSKPEQTYNEAGLHVTVWNVKTDNDGSWWVVQGDLPMNLYPQDKAYYFSTDEVFSFHLGIMTRLINDEASKPDRFIDYIAQGTDLSVNLRRKLSLATEKLQGAIEIEEIQAIGVVCRETLIELIGYVFEPEFLEEGQEPFKKSDVKNRGSVVINKFLPGPENAELRKHIRNLLNGAWDYSNIITHSSSRTIHEASVCLTMTTAVVSAFENLLEKYHDPLAGMKCKECGSRRLIIEENDETAALLIICENCRHEFIKE